MSVASWLLPKHPSGLLGGVVSKRGPFPASGTPGLAPLGSWVSGLLAACVTAWREAGSEGLGCLLLCLLCPHCLQGCVASLLIPGSLSGASIHGAQGKHFTTDHEERRVLLTL